MTDNNHIQIFLYEVYRFKFTVEFWFWNLTQIDEIQYNYYLSRVWNRVWTNADFTILFTFTLMKATYGKFVININNRGLELSPYFIFFFVLLYLLSSLRLWGVLLFLMPSIFFLASTLFFRFPGYWKFWFSVSILVFFLVKFVYWEIGIGIF